MNEHFMAQRIYLLLKIRELSFLRHIVSNRKKNLHSLRKRSLNRLGSGGKGVGAWLARGSSIT